jgi:hypothetical protein
LRVCEARSTPCGLPSQEEGNRAAEAEEEVVEEEEAAEATDQRPWSRFILRLVVWVRERQHRCTHPEVLLKVVLNTLAAHPSLRTLTLGNPG